MALGVNIVSEFNATGIKKAIADFKKLEGAGAKSTYALRTMDGAISNGIANVAKYGAIIAGTAGVFAYSLVNAASAVEESMSKVRVVFGDSADAVIKFAEQSSSSIGLSKQQALEAAGTYGNLFQAFGIGKQASQEMSTELVKLAADLASFNNASVDDALQALRSGLSGETEPLKRFGVALNDVRLKQEALNLGLYSGKGNLDIAAKSQAAFALIMKDTALAQGDFARTSDGVANQQRILAAQFADVRAELGEALIPVFKRLVGYITENVLPKVREFADVLKEKGIGGALKFVRDEFLNFTSSGGKFKDIIMGLTTAFVALRLVTIAATISQNLFNVALLSNPIGIVVAAIIAVGVALVAAYLRFEGFRKVVQTVANAAIAAWEFMTNIMIKGINLVIKAINFFRPLLSKVGINFGELGEIGEVTFGRIGAAANKAKVQVKDVTQAIIDAKNAERIAEGKAAREAADGGGAGGGVGGGVAKAVKTAKEKLREYIDALKGTSDAERSLTRSGKDVVAARADLAKATQKVADAQAKFNQITRGYGADSKEAVDAMRKVQDAARRLRDANLSQQDAVRGLAAAEKKLADLRALTANPEDVADAERKLERSKYNSEEAVFRVADAEAELAKVRLDPESSAVDIRRAEIALAEAKLGVTDATIAQRNAENELHKMRTTAATAEELAEAERDLERAKYAVEDATTAVKDATIEQTVAQAFYTEIVEGAKEGSEAYTAALRDLLDAQEAERDASEKVTDALWKQYEATEALRDAKEKLAAAEREAGAAIVARGQAQFARNMPGSLGAAGGAATAAPAAANNATTVVNNITAGMGADAKEIAQVIVDSLRDYERSNGFIPVTAQYAIAI
jgi:hypothetical protein